MSFRCRRVPVFAKVFGLPVIWPIAGGASWYFPRENLTPDGKLQTFRAGVGLLADHLELPVVPLRMDGAYEIREAHSLFNRPGRIRVHIGAPVMFPEGSDPQEIARELERRVAELGNEAEKSKAAAAGN